MRNRKSNSSGRARNGLALELKIGEDKQGYAVHRNDYAKGEDDVADQKDYDPIDFNGDERLLFFDFDERFNLFFSICFGFLEIMETSDF